jgi:hypothetical protein
VQNRGNLWFAQRDLLRLFLKLPPDALYILLRRSVPPLF